jgi:branched-chain amino acid transport system permease protein
MVPRSLAGPFAWCRCVGKTMLIQVLNGLVYGGLLYVLAVGLVLIFGLRRVVNFAHGSLYMVGAYVGYTASTVAGFWVGLVVSVCVPPLSGSSWAWARRG